MKWWSLNPRSFLKFVPVKDTLEPMSKGQPYTYTDAIGFLEALLMERDDLVWDRERMKVQSPDFSEDNGFEFRMPWYYPRPEEDVDLEDYLEDLDLVPPPYLLILIQAGHSAIGYFEEGEVMFHKTVKKYMVRAGQGKAQIGYLNTRGKSKAGSRVRLANTVSFFEDINEKLTEWEVMQDVERILIHCPIRLQALLYGSKVPPPFSKDDPRIRKVPIDVHRPDHAELLRVSGVGLKGWLSGELE